MKGQSQGNNAESDTVRYAKLSSVPRVHTHTHTSYEPLLLLSSSPSGYTIRENDPAHTHSVTLEMISSFGRVGTPWVHPLSVGESHEGIHGCCVFRVGMAMFHGQLLHPPAPS